MDRQDRKIAIASRKIHDGIAVFLMQFLHPPTLILWLVMSLVMAT